MQSKSKKQLQDVMIMRPIVIILLVFMHSFTMYTGGAWPLPKGIHNVGAYNWLTQLTFSFMLETFVFISGYLLCFQIQNRGEYSYAKFLSKKVKRLLIPSIIFSLAYYLLFIQYQGISHILQSVLNGCGHMWYLPMIFWCFVVGYIFYKLQIPSFLKLGFCIIVCSMSGFLHFLPMQVGSTCYYFLFFYLGMYFYEKREKISLVVANKIMITAVLFIVLFVAFILLRNYLLALNIDAIVFKVCRLVFLSFSRMIYGFLGVITFYWVVEKYLDRHKDFSAPTWLIWLNSISFGVYIYQQFILKALYYHTVLPELLGTYLLPWVGFIAAMMGSMVLSHFTIKTKFGRFLIG